MVMKKGGKKAKKAKKIVNSDVERKIIFKEPGQEYAKVTKMLGDCRVTLDCVDGKTRLGHIRGSMTGRKKVYINPGDTVLISHREYQDAKADIIHLYTKKEVKQLCSFGEVPADYEGGEEEVVEELGFDFDDDGDNEEKKEIDVDAL